jgi:hypothetical protein
MIRRILLPVLALLSFGSAAMAQDAGGVGLAPGLIGKGGPVGLARPLPFVRPPLLTARDVQNGMTPADRQAQNQSMITALRGDPGYLSGFSFGTPLAASRQPVPVADGGYYERHHHHGGKTVVINNAGPLAVTVGNGNVVQQQSATGGGPVAQQQVATLPGGGGPGGSVAGGGAVNFVSGSGNIVQRAPNGR